MPSRQRWWFRWHEYLKNRISETEWSRMVPFFELLTSVDCNVGNSKHLEILEADAQLGQLVVVAESLRISEALQRPTTILTVSTVPTALSKSSKSWAVATATAPWSPISFKPRMFAVQIVEKCRNHPKSKPRLDQSLSSSSLSSSCFSSSSFVTMLMSRPTHAWFWACLLLCPWFCPPFLLCFPSVCFVVLISILEIQVACPSTGWPPLHA